MKNIIEIKGASLNDVKQALENWIDLYSDNFSSKLDFKIFDNGIDRQIIIADNLLDNKHFFYLLNYLKFPEGIEYNVEIKGLAKGKNIDKRLNDKELLVYISKNDKEFDNVYVVTTENKHYKIDFGGKVTQQADNKFYSTFDMSNLKNPLTLSIKANHKRLKEDKLELKISKRFKIVFYISIIAILIHFFVPYLTDNVKIIEKWTLFTGMGIGLWFFMDYEMLRINDFYIKSLLVAVGFFCYGYLFRNYYQENIFDLNSVSFIYPLSLLIVQYPIRQLYKVIFNREPEVDKHGKFADLIYTMILFFAFALLPFIIFDYLKK
ncbi:hypothetical protein GZ212_13730 [Mangrovimonas sp. CR14]|uniref:hypothetical protein n=1 Tax=Mangrovimonas sp. CR14 TaxID=2706120 RepID=UPI00142182E0|nr:hypothetical protein [Mangrovimonas sp. CR14]NIK93218.1 hypothetical protein [Mangrovimonas sp. CR14]